MSKIDYVRVVDVYDSDNVETIAFSMDSKIMKVVFKTTAEYIYHNVTPHIFGAIVCSENVGKFLYIMVTSKPDEFPYERIDI